jgi:hypothetical protein
MSTRGSGWPVVGSLRKPRRTTRDETEFMSLTFCGDLDSVRAFAGPYYETTVAADAAREVRVRFDDHVGHDETAFETS